MQKVSILWADDEIDLLKPHILFLKAKGYDITAVTSGYDAIEKVEQRPFDVVFLDENMPGISGLEALNKIKQLQPNLPVVMITKSEEEYIMEEAIGSKISDYLIKPVNPSQILLSLKKLIDQNRLVGEKAISSYQQDFRNLSMSFNDELSATEWAEIYQKLIYWELELSRSDENGMKEVFAMQKSEANVQFSKFIRKNYRTWLTQPDSETPVMSHNLLKNKLFPLLQSKEPVCLLLIDNLRLDQFRVLEEVLSTVYRTVSAETYFSILPTSTEYARNSLFAGYLPADIKRRYPDKWSDFDNEEGSKNQHEEFFLRELLKRNSIDIKLSYNKITSLIKGKTLAENPSNLWQNSLNVIVYNFVDMLSHARSEMNVIKELAEDEAAYRSITRSWFEHSPLFDLIKKMADKKIKLVLTTDHGSIKVGEPTRIVGDKYTTTNLRYKEGKSLSYDDKDLFVVSKPEEISLTKPFLSSTYVFATEDKYFVYPNNYNQYVNMYRNTFQHGGVSLEEMIVPFAVFEPK